MQFLINHSDKKQEGQNIIYEGKDTNDLAEAVGCYIADVDIRQVSLAGNTRTRKLLDAEFQIRRTPASLKRGTRYAVKKFTIIDNGNEYGV